MKKIIFLLFILSCLFNSCKSIDFGKQNSVFIMLYDFDNAPLKDVVIKVDDKVIGQSDVNGRFVFDVYDLERHSVVISKEGYETIVDNFVYQNSLVLYYRLGNSAQYLKIAEEHLDNENFEQSLISVNKSLSISSNKEDALYLKAIILNKLDKKEESNLILKKIEKTKKNIKFIEKLEKENEEKN